MKRVGVLAGVTVILAGLVWLMVANTEPQPVVHPEVLFHTVTVPDRRQDLDGWLIQQESRYRDLKPWARKKVLWADPVHKTQTQIALVYLHGYSATRKEISPSVEDLGKELGANVFFTRYTGCGLTQDPEKGVVLKDWLDDTVEALKIGNLLGHKVVLIGTSTGGTFAAWIALSPLASQIAATILISPNFTPADGRTEMLLWPGNKLLVQLILGPTMEFKPINSLQAAIWDYQHSTDSLIPMMQIVNLVRHENFADWKTPTLLFYSPLDKIVNEKVTLGLFAKSPAGMVEQVRIDHPANPEGHVLSGEAEASAYTSTWVALSKAFLERVLAPSR